VVARATLTLLSRAALALALVLLMAWVVQPVPWVLRVMPAALAVLSLARPAVGLVDAPLPGSTLALPPEAIPESSARAATVLSYHLPSAPSSVRTDPTCAR
jgi:hypothetical protein